MKENRKVLGDVTCIDRTLIPDCCITCQELYIKGDTLRCNVDGTDILPSFICVDYKRLKLYGKYNCRR